MYPDSKSAPVLGRLQAAARIAAPNRLERACLGTALAGAALALAASLAQAALPPIPTTPDELRRAVSRAGPDAAACPDGWAAAQAPQVGLTEAELTAWYLREALTLDDAAVVAGVGALLSWPADTSGPRAQILLCIAQSRRMTVPEA